MSLRNDVDALSSMVLIDLKSWEKLKIISEKSSSVGVWFSTMA